MAAIDRVAHIGVDMAVRFTWPAIFLSDGTADLATNRLNRSLSRAATQASQGVRG